MLEPSMNSLLNEGQSYYSLVIGVAKKAREIAQNAKDTKTILSQKPVKIAVDSLAEGKYHLTEQNDIGLKIER